MLIRSIVLAAATLLGVPMAPASATTPGVNGKIVVSRSTEVEGSKRPLWDIVVMNRNGRRMRPLTVSGKAWNPEVSPDGEEVAYVCGNYKHFSQICLKPIGGGKEKVLTQGAGHKAGLTWSPDGGWIAYGVYESGEPAAVYRMRKDGSEVALVWKAEGADYVWGISGLSWSPDGETIAFENIVFVGQKNEIWGVGPDGSNPRPLVRGHQWISSPDYSPDGERIMFLDYPDGNVGQVFHTPAECSPGCDDENQVTSGEKIAYAPTFSPDGTKFLFVRNGTLFKRNIDGTSLQPVRRRTKGVRFRWASWQPR